MPSIQETLGSIPSTNESSALQGISWALGRESAHPLKKNKTAYEIQELVGNSQLGLDHT